MPRLLDLAFLSVTVLLSAVLSPAPVRAGNCNSPDDLDSRGRRCGGRAASVRSGGSDTSPRQSTGNGTQSWRSDFYYLDTQEWPYIPAGATRFQRSHAPFNVIPGKALSGTRFSGRIGEQEVNVEFSCVKPLPDSDPIAALATARLEQLVSQAKEVKAKIEYIVKDGTNVSLVMVDGSAAAAVLLREGLIQLDPNLPCGVYLDELMMASDDGKASKQGIWSKSGN